MIATVWRTAPSQRDDVFGLAPMPRPWVTRWRGRWWAAYSDGSASVHPTWAEAFEWAFEWAVAQQEREVCS